MDTYNNKIDELKRISFVEENIILNDLVIKEDPINYLEIAKGAINLNYIRVPEIQTREYYQNLKQLKE